MTTYNPARETIFERLAPAPELHVTSPDLKDGRLAAENASAIFGVPGGRDISPALAWSGAPDDTVSYVVLGYDPDAPTLAGFWHWGVYNIPASVTSLPANAGDPETGNLPEGAVTVTNDAGLKRYIGAAPPAGHGAHRYFFVVHALKTTLELPEGATPTFLAFNVFGSEPLARGHVMATFEVPA
ncbi:YbhB/YbcL family Raf kinase inhibitor-like protein [Micrococcales bacterium 31B]|nr:YbhB/YbcL family Raf kinase inhibitor-like protein [Micrococcales bacterium 31B]